MTYVDDEYLRDPRTKATGGPISADAAHRIGEVLAQIADLTVPPIGAKGIYSVVPALDGPAKPITVEDIFAVRDAILAAGNGPESDAERREGGAEGSRTPEGSTDDLRAAAIEAATQDIIGGPWDPEARDLAEIAYDAIEPLVRRAVAEEIAARIEAECIDPEWPNDAESTNGAHAAAIARQAGGGE